jgi:glycerophosphoryl diester phosphodiesterase
MAAFQQALDLGVDLIELDVTRTSDGQAVVFHGPGLQKAAGVDRTIFDLTLDKARQLDIGSWKDPRFAGERILSLREALEFARGRVNLAVDLKAFDIVPEIARCIYDADMVEQVLICGCDVSAARQVRECGPDLSVGLNLDAEMEGLATGADPARFRAAYVRQATENHLSPLNVSYRYVTADLVRLAHLRAVQVWAWTVDEPEDMRRLIAMGIDALYTNCPKLLLQVLSEQAAPGSPSSGGQT